MKKRLDTFLVDNFNISSRTKAQNLIKENLVIINDKIVDKVSFMVDENDKIEIAKHQSYVSRGAYKLLGAIKKFDLDLNNKIVLDIGASTGGFTQVALLNGAQKVYALDIGKSELDKSLFDNPFVVNLSEQDIRTLNVDKTPDVNFIVGDLSFISLTKILPHVIKLYGNKIEAVFLFKPQFECGKEIAKKYKGIIKNPQVHKTLLKEFLSYLSSIGFYPCGLTHSPITGGDGNIEYLLYFNGPLSPFDYEQVVISAFEDLKNKK